MARLLPVLPFILACVGVASFALMDAMMKQASLAIGALSAIFLRNVIGFVISGPVWVATRKGWPSRAALKLHFRRSIVVAAMTYLFFWALTKMPMAEAIAVSFIAPVIALYLAHLLLGETIARTAIWASLCGTGGVGIIMAGRMQGGYDIAVLLPIAAVLLSAALYAYNLILSKRQALIAKPVEIGFFQCLYISLCLTPFVGFFTFPQDIGLWLVLTAAAALALMGIGLLAWAYARAEAQQLIPVEYTAFIWAILFGWLFFDERPDAWVIAGAGMIISGSLMAARNRPERARIEPTQL